MGPLHSVTSVSSSQSHTPSYGSLAKVTPDYISTTMFIPQLGVSNLSNGRSVVALLEQRPLSLDTSGVLGLLGGEDAISAMAAVHIYGNRRWLGWYNNPGSYQIFKRLSSFSKSTSSCNVSSGNISLNFFSAARNVDVDPTVLLGSDGYKGPKFRAAHSGTVLEETGYLAALFMKECAAWNSEGKVVAGRRTQPVGITIADLDQAPASEMHPARSNPFTLLSASVPIFVNLATCAVCAAVDDWYASSLILVGMAASGACCLVLGAADFVFIHPEPAKGSPAGDGMLGSDKDIVLLKGTEGAVNSITRGRFSLRFASPAHLTLLRWCSFLFFIQCIAQLLFIPQASLFGQVMFLTSLGISALYSVWLSSSDKEKMQRKMLFSNVLENPALTKYTLGTRTAAVVFTLLVLRPQDPTKLLNELLPNDTKVWKQWKTTILEQLRHPMDQYFLSEVKLGDMNRFTQQEQDLLHLLLEDARAAYNGYRDYLQVDTK